MQSTFYATARPSKKKATAALLIPAGLTALMAGITEPVEFTFLFAAPVLWGVHALLAATMDAIMYACGIVGEFSLGLIGFASENWIPLWQYHWASYVLQIVIGLIFSGIYFIVFKFLIEKYNYATPGREADDETATLMTKKEYKQRKTTSEVSDGNNQPADPYVERATAYLDALGGSANVAEITSCATRLRITVNDENKVASDAVFKSNKAVGVVRHGKALQVIVGLDVPQVLESIQGLMSDNGENVSAVKDVPTIPTDPINQSAALLMDSMGTNENIISAAGKGNQLQVDVKDVTFVDSESVFETLNVGAQDVHVANGQVTMTIEKAGEIATAINQQR